MIMAAQAEHTLEFLLAFDGRRHWYEQGYFAKFEIRRVEPTAARPHGLSYSFTLHDPDGKRLIGFDNAHAVRTTGSRFRKQPAASDHWHRTESDPGRPYAFESAEKLIDDFFTEIERVLTERGIALVVVRDEEDRS
jgi:RimJ/RimL family protein N-acetyltransferase